MMESVAVPPVFRPAGHMPLLRRQCGRIVRVS